MDEDEKGPLVVALEKKVTLLQKKLREASVEVILHYFGINSKNLPFVTRDNASAL